MKDKDTTRCLLTALAARTTGRYELLSTEVTGGPSENVRHTIIIEAGGTVVHATQAETAGTDDPSPFVMRCTLKPATYFEACVGLLDAELPRAPAAKLSDELWRCVLGQWMTSSQEWYERCEQESPAVCP